MKKSLSMRLLAMLLCLAMLLPNFGVLANAADTQTRAGETPLAVLYAGSDFQYSVGADSEAVDTNRSYGTDRMKTILNAIKSAGYTTVDEALFLGDYEPSVYTSQTYGIEATHKAFNDVWGLSYDDILFLQGNHDNWDMPYLDGAKEAYTTASGGVIKEGGYIYTLDREYYDVVMIHEDAFPEARLNDTYDAVKHQVTQQTATALEDYLVNTKAGSAKPIFIMGHIPLHYTRQDNIYARYLVDAINAGVDAGRNVFFMFGHNHSSSGYDNYLGGSAIYFDAGSKLQVPNIAAAQAGKDASDLVEFKFTYMNAGYVGFYGSLAAGDNYGISSTIIEVYEDRVEFTRYNPSGVTNLKASGWKNASGAAASYAADTTTVASPRAVNFQKLVAPADAVSLSNSNNNAYKLVTDLSTITAGKNYMILNTDQVGTAVGMSGATTAGVRASGNVLLKTAPSVFAIPGMGNTGEVYTTNTHNYDMWQFETDSEMPGGYKMFVSGTRLFLTANDNVFGITGNGTDVANMRMGSSFRSNGTIWWDVPTASGDKVNALQYGIGDPCINNMKTAPAGYYLGYNTAGGYFQLSNSAANSTVYLYEETGLKLSDVKLWVEGDGEIAVGSAGSDVVSGAMLCVVAGDAATRIKITADMLSGADLNTAGEQSCSVTYNGITVKTGFSLNVVEESTGGNEGGNGGNDDDEIAVPGETVTLHENLFELITNDSDRVDGEQYVIVDRATAGAGHILDINESNGSYSVVGNAVTVFALDGGIYVQPDENTSIWKIDGHMVSGYRSYLQNTVYTNRYLQANDNGVVDTGTKVVTAGDAMYAQGWRIDTTLAIGGHPERYVVYNNGWSSSEYEWAIPAISGVSYFYRKSSIDKITANVNDTSGRIVKGNTGELKTGEYIIITTTKTDGTSTTKQVPITTDMLSVTNVQLSNYGVYTCSVTYQDKVICDDFVLTVTDEYGNTPEPVTILENVYELTNTTYWTSHQDGYKYVIVNRNTAGSGNALGVSNSGSTYSITADGAEVFTIDGMSGVYVQAEEANWVWVSAKASGGYLNYLENAEFTGQDLLMSTSTTPVLSLGTRDSSGYQKGWRCYDSTATLVTTANGGGVNGSILFKNGNFVAGTRSGDGNGTAYVYRESDLQSITAYASDNSAYLEIGDLGAGGVLPDKYLVVTTTVNGTATTEMVPITAEMLGLTTAQLNKAGDYTGKLTYMGKTVCEEFEVSVRYPGGVLTEPVDLTEKLGAMYKYSKAQLVANQEYMIVTRDTVGDGYALSIIMDDNGKYTITAVPVEVKMLAGSTELYVQAHDDSWVWKTEANSSASGRYFLKNNGITDQYLYGVVVSLDSQKAALAVGPAAEAKASGINGWYLRNSELDHDYSIYDYKGDQVIAFNGSQFYAESSYNWSSISHGNVYVKDTSIAIQAYVDALQGTIAAGEISNLATGGNVVVVTTANGVSSKENVPITVDMLQGITLTDLHTPGEYTCSVWYEGAKICDDYVLTVTGEESSGFAELPGNGRDILGYLVSVDKVMSDILPTGSAGSTSTGSTMTIYTYMTNGTASKQEVPVTIGMLDKRIGTMDDYINTPGSHAMMLSFNGNLITENYTLNLVAATVKDDYPDFPDNGSVRVDKQLDTTKSNYLETGSAQIDLSVTGISTTDKANVVIVLDGSSSMTMCVHDADMGATCPITKKVVGTGSNNCATRELIIRQALTNLLNYLNEDINGYKMDIDVSVAYFNQYAAIDTDYKLKDSMSTNAAENLEDEVMWEFSDVEDAIANINTILGNYHLLSDTNFDRGMFNAYTLLKDKQIRDYQEYADGIKAGTITGDYEPRQDFVLFMSDGAPYQYNYISFLQANYEHWSKYLKGTLDETLNPGETYVSKGYIDEDIADVFEKFYHPEGKHWMAEAIKGDETQKYKVIDPNTSSADHISYVNGLGATILTVGLCAGEGIAALEKMASDKEHSYEAATAEAVEAAFTAFGSLVRTAKGANFRDQMGSEFDLVMKPGSTITLTKHELWKNSDDDATAELIGKRKGTTPIVLEEVTFTSDGKAYSSAIDSGSKNIMVDGVICGKNFWYNTSTTTAMLIDTNSDGINETSLEPETFYWSVGAIPEDELVLSYSVYLTGSMEGSRADGRYPTNNYAYLSYVNNLGHDCRLDTTSPELPWGHATVGYAFYMVDSNGKPVINKGTGELGSFENAIKLTQPVYQDFTLNSNASVEAGKTLAASNLLPDGYSLYDPNVNYKVTMASNGNGSWTITGGNGTTYVTGYGGNPTNDQDARNGSEGYNAYFTSSTIVWFAVVADTRAVPDTVIIDFGLPVDINVLTNDVMMATGKAMLAGIGAWRNSGNVDFTGTLASGFSPDSYTDTFGKAQLMDDGAKDVDNAVIRYTLNSMKMDCEETFSYAVHYTGDVGSQGYYYSTVTVIPATSIYFEDNFVSYTGNWTTVGTTSDATQDQDRTGKFSLPEIDANNIYGYDSAYANMTQYSLGSAKKVTVSGNQDAKATFTFKGTGFDIVSLTSNRSGTILITVDRVDDTSVNDQYYMVDTYYGYKYEGGQWVVDANASNTLYQIPVMKVVDLPYGEYSVEIYVAYADFFAHNNTGSYDFYLDAIRIYDPANNGASSQVVQDAYVADGEGWPNYQELRNKLISVNSFDGLGENKINGAVFIDGINSVGSAAIANYSNYGPNNEVYLASGQAVAFKLEAVGDVAGIHLGLKSVGGTAKCLIYNADANQEDAKERTINTATEMYYDITDLNNQVVIILNSGSSGTILSITNIKVTYHSAPASGKNLNVYTVDKNSVANALASLNEANEPDYIKPDGPQVAGAIAPQFATLSFEGEVLLDVYYAVNDLEGVTADDMGLITFSAPVTDGTVENAEAIIPGAIYDHSRGFYFVQTEGIPAKKLGDEIYFRVYAKLADGSYVYSDMYNYSAKTYADNVLAGSGYSDKLKTLVVAMLNYGAAAQEYFGYKTDTLVNADLSAQEQALVAQYSSDMVADFVAVDAAKVGSFAATTDGFSKKYPTVSFEGAFSIDYHFTPNMVVDGDMVLYYWNQAAYESAAVLTAENATGTLVMTGESVYQTSVSGIVAKEIDSTVYVAAVYESGGATYCSGVLAYSVGTYCASRINSADAAMQSFAAATAVYGYYAKQYFAV